MIKTFTLLIFSFLISFAHAQDLGKVTGGKLYENPSWFTESFLDIAEDVEEASDDEKKVILFFHLAGCPYCNAMLDQNFKSGKNPDFIKQNFIVIAVNVKGDREITMPDGESMSEKELAKLLGVKYTPAIVFLDKNGKQVFRTNGYRNSELFANTLKYVSQGHYQSQTLNQFVAQESKTKYRFLPHEQLKTVNNFKGYNKPVAMLFEDENCTGCAHFHQKLINRDDVKKALSDFLFVRFDGNSNESITDFDGNTTTPKQLAEKYNLNYRPGILLFDNGQKIIEIDNTLYSFHFNTVLSFVSGKHYEVHENFSSYRNEHQQKLLEQGIDISIVD